MFQFTAHPYSSVEREETHRFEKLVTNVIIDVPAEFFKKRNSQEIWNIRRRLQRHWLFYDVECKINEEVISYDCKLGELPTVATIDDLVETWSGYHEEMLKLLIPTCLSFELSLHIGVSSEEIEDYSNG